MSLPNTHPLYDFNGFANKSQVALESICEELENMGLDSLEDQYRLSRAQLELFLKLRNIRNMNIAAAKMTELAHRIKGTNTIFEIRELLKEKIVYPSGIVSNLIINERCKGKIND